MLQQTQVSRVQVIFVNFVRQFPTLHHLAAAANRDVLLAWRGMGYNSRALRLRDAARTIADRYNGVFPREMSVLQDIKGIGQYTAAAIRNFAFNIPTPCIDTNIRRILHRTFVGPEYPDGSAKRGDDFLLKIAGEVLEAAVDGTGEHDARNWHAALMDFGSLVQTKRHPRWERCPLTEKGLMVTTPRSFSRVQKEADSLSRAHRSVREPGRKISGRFVPNRLIRGRIVEALRDAPSGLSLHVLGRRVAADWSTVRHGIWLKGILRTLQRDALIEERTGSYFLA